jgi:16S rRNA (cytosine967-C5)-methyltransferase
MPASAARKIAYEVLLRVATEGAYASDLLHSRLGAHLKNEDAALATEISFGVLRWQRLLDFLLELHMKKPVAELDVPVAIALRMGIYQLRFLQRVPAHAAVHESVELVKSARKASASTLVNAVLRRASDQARLPAEQLIAVRGHKLSSVDRVSILHSHPAWMVERWFAQFGEPAAIDVLDANNRPPRLSCLLSDPSSREKIFAELERDSLQIEPGALLRESFSVSGSSIVRTAAFRRGEISVQDEASQLVAHLLSVRPGDRVLDVCAAPGGKTAILARAALPNGTVIATDLHAHRLRATRDQLARIGATNVTLVGLDATKPLAFRNQFDRILVDAPCSGTGTLARHPEIRWRLTAQQLPAYHELQASLLKSALERLAPGGRLVYSTCSIEPEEDNEVVASVLRETKDEFRRVPTAQLAPPLANKLAPEINSATLFDADSQFRILPGQHSTDGFFAAAIERPHSV